MSGDFFLQLVRCGALTMCPRVRRRTVFIELQRVFVSFGVCVRSSRDVEKGVEVLSAPDMVELKVYERGQCTIV